MGVRRCAKRGRAKDRKSMMQVFAQELGGITVVSTAHADDSDF
jgi:hypothetical protein